MTTLIASVGEPVTTEDGKVICYVKNSLFRNASMMAGDFHNFAEGERPWVGGEQVDQRCVRQDGNRMQICIKGEWRP